MSNRPTSFKKALKPAETKTRAKPRETNSLLKDIESLNKEKILRADDSDVKELRDLLMDARRKLSPYSVKVEDCDEGSLIFSFINMQRDYMIKLITTTMVGFLRRSANEWQVPPNVPVIDVADYLRDPSLADPIEPVDGRKLPAEDLEAYESNKRMMIKRMVIVEFLEYLFGYDPDRHARPGYKPNYKDPERRPIITPSAEMAVLLEKKRTEKSRRANVAEKKEAAELYELFLEEKRKAAEGVEIEKPCVREVIRTIKGRDGKPMKVKRTIKCTETEFKLAQLKRDNPDDPDNLKVLRTDKKVIPMGDPDYNDYFDRRNQVRDQALHDTVRDLIPPGDFFYRFNVYLDKHYEQLMDATRDLYHEKPDFDASIFPYRHITPKEDPETHEMLSIAEQVKRFRHEKARDIHFGINEVKFGNWTMIAPYKQNRDRIEYFGANMAIFDEMFKMKAAERTLAKDMMDKGVERKRRDIERVHGKKDPEFDKNYGAIGSENLSKYGVDRINEEDEENKLLDELDAIKVGLVRISQGGRKIDIDKIYTKSEAPEFMVK